MTAVDVPARPLRIGLMLRAVDDVDGQGIYIRKLCEALFELDSQNQYVAYYWRPDQVGRFADHPNVREVVVPGRNKLAWDQVLVPLAARRDLLDVLFHHKFSIPLLAPCPTVVQQRGTEYWSHPEFYTGWSGRVDRLYSRFMIPLYCRKAVRVLTNSDTLGEELVRYVGVPRSKLRTVYASADRSFRPIADSAALAEVRARYGLPQEPFLLMVVKGHQVVGQASGRALTPRKNVALAIEGYGRMRARALADGLTPPDLVILGPGIAERLTPEVIAAHTDPGALPRPASWSSRICLPLQHGAGAGVSLALRELRHPHRGGDGLRLPVITATTSACPEVAGDAAILVDPDDVEGLASAMYRVSLDDDLAEDLRRRGLRRRRASPGPRARGRF